MANRLPAPTRRCRYCGETFGGRGVTSHETRYCPSRPTDQIDAQATAGARKTHKISELLVTD